VRVTLDVDVLRAADVRVQFQVTPKNFDAPAQEFEFAQHLETRGAYSFAFQLDAPRVWNPWDRGEPNLYTLTTRVLDDASALDTHKTTFGLRTIELASNPGAPTDSAPWTFVVNGQPEFIRGTNWVPADAIPARVTRTDYAELLQLARDANINLLRVWGGGLKEKRAFYDLCDELGILIWQEFPLTGAGIDYFPRDAAYVEALKQEATGIVQALRNHPSVVLWCGGNEFIPRVNRHVTTVLRDVAAKHDGTRPFKIASPSQDESHNWRVWHGGANTRDYEKDDALFFGEFGLQSAPNVETLTRFLADDAMFPPNADWAYHNADLDKLWRYARPHLSLQPPREISLPEFVDASQEAQLRGLQIAIESARRSKPRVSGCAFWQFNEPWYAICWSVVDYARKPKRAYHKIKELYNPVLVSFAYPRRPYNAGEIVRGEIWLVNDALRQIQGTLSVWHNDARVLTQAVALEANQARAWTELEVALAQDSNLVRVELRAPECIATNDYDLNVCDIGEINPRRAFLQNAAARLRTST
jgi:beta-mannosidase